MRASQKFSPAELEQIESAKQIFMRIPFLKRCLQNGKESIKKMDADLISLSCRRAKLSEMPGNGCKRPGYNTAYTYIDKKIDEKDELERKKDSVKAELKKIEETIDKMPTKLYRDILTRLYYDISNGTKTTQHDRDLRRYHINNAYLEFYHTWENKE